MSKGLPSIKSEILGYYSYNDTACMAHGATVQWNRTFSIADTLLYRTKTRNTSQLSEMCTPRHSVKRTDFAVGCPYLRDVYIFMTPVLE